MKHTTLFLLLIMACTLFQCMPYKEEKITEINYSLKDELLQKLLDFQDKQQTDSLFQFFQHQDPTYRYAAAMAFASFQEPTALDSLTKLLNDDIEEVRIAAAYSIGQLADERAENQLVAAFSGKDSTSNHEVLNRTILEAVGKSASAKFLPLISTTSTYRRTDTLLLEGQAWAIYRFAFRQITSPEGTERMVDFITKVGYPERVRFIAANYLSRARDIQLDTFTVPLVRAFQKETDYKIQMTLAIALGKTKRPEALAALKDAYTTASDYRVKCNIIRAFGNFDYLAIQQEVKAALDDSNQAVTQTAAQFLIDHGEGRDGANYWRKARDTSLNTSTQLLLYAAANTHTPPYFEATIGSINADLRRRLSVTTDAYEKAAILSALSHYGWNYRYVKEQGYTSDQPVVRTATVNALATLARRPDFATFFGQSKTRVRKDLAEYFSEAIKRSDAGMIAEAASILRHPALNFKELVPDFAFMTEALNKLVLPKEIETYNELQKTINHFKGLPEGEPKKPKFSHPIDWRVVKTVTATTRAKIMTNKGNIVLQFMIDDAPASVANFVMLSRAGFYDQKFIHRVVPNFVIQGGCPRGDGYGSLDHSIRSELPPLNYDDEGYVGMASAGLHTECSQWFITHAPAPHLDGRYTIFAKVVDGMDIVHQIQVGDQITRIVIE